LKEAERKRLFLGLHIDRRPINKQAHEDISAIFSKPYYRQRKESPELVANRESLKARFSLLKEMGVLETLVKK